MFEMPWQPLSLLFTEGEIYQYNMWSAVAWQALKVPQLRPGEWGILGQALGGVPVSTGLWIVKKEGPKTEKWNKKAQAKQKLYFI